MQTKKDMKKMHDETSKMRTHYAKKSNQKSQGLVQKESFADFAEEEAEYRKEEMEQF